MLKFFVIAIAFIATITAAIRINTVDGTHTVVSLGVDSAVSSTPNRTHCKVTPTVCHTSTATPTPTTSHTMDGIQLLMHKALLAKSHREFGKSIELYNRIITLLHESNDPDELELFAQAHFQKASILEFNLHDPEEAIHTYQQLVSKLQTYETPKLIELTTKAQLYHASMVDPSESLSIYNGIIQRFQESSEPTQLHSYALAQFAKSYMVGNDEAMRIYNEMIEALRFSDEKPLLQQLYQAKSDKAYTLEHTYNDPDAALQVYDEIIAQYSQYDDESYREQVESALFSKSFLLIHTEQKAEAMAIFDDLIDYYQQTLNGETPSNLEYAILNNIELALVTGKDDSRYQELAQTYLHNSSEAQPQIEMLQILDHAQNSDPNQALAMWQEKYQTFQFQNWSFDQLESWSTQITDPEIQARISHCLEVFQNHNQNNATTSDESHHSQTE